MSDLPPDTKVADQKFIEDLAKHHKDQYVAGVSKSSTLLFAWTAALMLLLIQPMIPLWLSVSEAERYLNSVERYQARKQVVAMSDEEGKRAEVDNLKKNISTEAKQIIDALKKVQKVATPLGTVDAPAALAPPIYSIFIGGFLLLLLQRRMVLGTTALKVLYLRLELLRHTPEQVKELGSWTPFWMAPMPAVDGAQERRNDLEHKMLRFLGWRSQRGRAVALTITVCIIPIVWAWIIRLDYRLDQLIQRLPEFRELWASDKDALAAYEEIVRQTWITRSIGAWQIHALLMVVCMVLCFGFLRPVVPWGAFPEELTSRGYARRSLLRGSIVAVAVCAVAVAVPPTIRAIPRHLPRFRRRNRRQATPLPRFVGWFVLNAASCIVHYITPRQSSLGRLPLEPSHLSIVSPDFLEKVAGRDQPPEPRMNRRYARFMIECAAVQAARLGDLEGAIRILTPIAQQHPDKPYARLFDLLAGLLHRSHATASDRQNFVALTRSSLDKRIQAAGLRLMNPTARWSREWEGEQLPWRMPWEGKATSLRHVARRVFRRLAKWGRSSKAGSRKQIGVRVPSDPNRFPKGSA